MKSNASHPSVSSKRLGRQGQAGRDVITKHPDQAAIQTFAATLGTTAERYDSQQKAVASLQVQLDASRVDRDRKVAELVVVTHASVGVLSAHIEGFDEANVPRNPSVPLDALRDANRIEEVLRLQGAHISGGEHVLAELQQSIAAAGTAIEATHDGRVAVQSARGDLRATARELHRLLVAFRLVLRVTLGRHHVDYQRMRNLAASVESEPPPDDDEGDEPSEVDTQTPA